MPLSRRYLPILAVTEPLRSFMSSLALAAVAPVLNRAPRGEPHPVLVLPGLLASDRSMATLRHWLQRLDYPVVGWNLGRNRGPTEEVVRVLPGLVERLADQHGSRVSIIGHSLGGIYARRLALRAPDYVRQVITLGSPFRMPERGLDASTEAMAFQRYSELDAPQPQGSSGGLLTVPSTAVYSRWDGVVDWRACMQQVTGTSENVAVHTGHLGLKHDPTVLWVIADRLAQPIDAWRPFTLPTRWGLRALFPKDGGAQGA